MIRLAAFADEANPSLQKQILALKRNGISMIELRGLDGVNISKISLEDAKNYARLLKDEGIEVWSIGSPVGKIDIANPFSETEEELRHICRLANIFGTSRIRMFSFKNAEGQGEKVVENLKKMVSIAKEFSCDLYHENEKKIFGEKAKDVTLLLDRVEGLKSIYDPANYIEVGEDPEMTLSALAPRADYYHIKDALLETGQIVPAGQGDGRILQLIKSISPEKDVTLTLEPHLAIFDGFAQIDESQLKNKYVFPDNETSFDAAVSALKQVLGEAGYEENEKGWNRK